MRTATVAAAEGEQFVKTTSQSFKKPEWETNRRRICRRVRHVLVSEKDVGKANEV